MEDEQSHFVPPNIPVDSHTFDIEFHPHSETLCLLTCHVSGDVCLWCQDSSTGAFHRKRTLSPHTKSCRTGKYFADGQHFVTGSSDKTCVVSSADGSVVWASSPYRDAINIVHTLQETLFISGDDSGRIALWDVRSSSASMVLNPYEESIFAIVHDSVFHPAEIVVTSGDTLAFYDLRYPKLSLRMISDPQEADLLSCATVKILCGSAANGVIGIFDWGNVCDVNDRIVNHAISVDQIIPIVSTIDGYDMLITGSGDGMIRLLSVFPHKILRTIGPHSNEEDPIDALALAPDKRLIVSAADDGNLSFHWLPSPQKLHDALLSRTPENMVAHAFGDKSTDFFSDL